MLWFFNVSKKNTIFWILAHLFPLYSANVLGSHQGSTSQLRPLALFVHPATLNPAVLFKGSLYSLGLTT